MKTSRCPVNHVLVAFATGLAVAAIPATAQNLFTEGFEGDFPGTEWTVGDANPNDTAAYWGKVSSTFGNESTHGGANKAYCAGVGYQGNTSSPVYQDYMSAFMSRNIDLTTASSANLTFWYKIPSIELGYDSARVLINGAPVWQRSATATSWTPVTINITPFVGGVRTLTFQFHSDLSVTAEGWYVDDISVATNVPPLNDAFAAYEAITGTAGRVAGSSVNGTKEAGEPNHAGNAGGHSIWYRYVAPMSGPLGIDTFGSSFDTLLGVYTGNLAALNLIAANDDAGPGNSRSHVAFTGVQGTAYYIAIDGRDGASGATVLNYRFAAGNDNFANASNLVGNAAWTGGHTGETTKEPGEPNHAGNPGGHSVWYRFTAATSAPLTLATVDPSFDTLLAVYTGSMGALTLVASNDNVAPGNLASRLTFNTTAGTTYRIAVDGVDGASGSFVLNHQHGALPDLTVYPASLNPSFANNTFQAGDCEVLEGCAVPGTRRLLRFTTETRNAGAADLFLGDPSGNPLFIYDACHGHYHFFEFADYRLRDLSDRIVATGGKVGFCLEDLARWNPSAPGSARYTCSNQGIQAGWADLYSSGLPCQYIDITEVPPGTYVLEIEFDPNNRIPEANESNNIARVTIEIPPDCTTAPPNNNFASSWLISGAPVVTNDYNGCATKEAGEPSHAGNSGGHSLWYRWVAPASASYVISTEGSSFDTLLAVYTGATLVGLTQVASNDDVQPGVVQSRVTFNAVAGTTYRIAVDGYNDSIVSAVGTIQLAINPPANDRFANCVSLQGPAGVTNGHTLGATREDDEPAHYLLPADHSVWYCWTSPGTASVQFDTEGSSFHTRLAVYTGTSLPGLTPLVSDHGSGEEHTSLVTFAATQGTTYRIAIDGEDRAMGQFTLHWNMQAQLRGERLGNGMFRINLTGVPGGQYRIEQSTNLQTWGLVTTLTAGLDGTATLDVGAITPGSTGFYRAISQ